MDIHEDNLNYKTAGLISQLTNIACTAIRFYRVTVCYIDCMNYCNIMESQVTKLSGM